jgi:hypothetical protein
MRPTHVENILNVIKRGGEDYTQLNGSHAGRRALVVFAGLLLNSYRGFEVEA